MDPRNLSPRVSDYEPVKDGPGDRSAHRARSSTNASTPRPWGPGRMGLLPEHLLDAEALRQEALLAGADPAEFGLRQSEFNRRPVGCGPFVFREWKSDQYIDARALRALLGGCPQLPPLRLPHRPRPPDPGDGVLRGHHRHLRGATPPGGAPRGRPALPELLGDLLQLQLHRLQPAPPALRRPARAPRPRHGDQRGRTSSATSCTTRASARPAPSCSRPSTTTARSPPCPTTRPARSPCWPRPAGSATARACSKKTASGCGSP